MTVFFGNFRLGMYLFVFALTATILGISAHFAQIFLPDFHHDLTILAIVASSVTIFVFLLLFAWSQPVLELIALFILGILWLAVGCTAADQIGQVECYPLADTTTPGRDGTTFSAQQFCYQMKVIEAFSITIFVLFVIAFGIVIALASRAAAMGDPEAWTNPIQELPWFGEDFDGRRGSRGSHYGGYPQQYGYPPGPGMMQQPGQTIIVQPGRRGERTQVQQIPMMR